VLFGTICSSSNLSTQASPVTEIESTSSSSATAKEKAAAAKEKAAEVKEPTAKEKGAPSKDTPATAASSESSAPSANTAKQASSNNDTVRKKKWAHASVSFTVAAPQDVVWNVLVDFEHYPEIFKRIETCKVTKREGDVVYTESYLKPQLFVSKRCNHTWIDLSQKPTALSWKLLDGNFKGAEGNWDCKTIDKGKTEVKYTLSSDPGPIIPAGLVSWILHSVVKEVVDSVQNTCAETYKQRSNSHLTK
jgi:ribosome-associated toxin RatA of RatAB toxin-antitoxin module